MITIPLWLFTGLCGMAGLAALAWIAALLRADKRVDRILAEELALPPICDEGQADRDDDGGRHRAEAGQP